MKARFAMALLIVLIAFPGATQESARKVITPDNAASLDLLIRLGRGSAEAVAWSPDGNTILVGGSIGVWKYDAAALDTQTEPPLIAVGGEVSDLAVSPDGTTLMVAHSGSDGMASYNLQSGELIQDIQLEEGGAQNLAFSSSGSYLAVNHGSYGAVTYDVAASNVYNTISGSLDSDVRILISPDDSRVIAANNSYAVLIWDRAAGGDPVTLTGHASYIEDMVINPDGTLLVTGSADDSFIVWDLTTNAMVQQVAMPEDDYSNRDVLAVTFSPDGSTLLTGHGNKVRFWSVPDFAMTSEVPVTGYVEDLVYSPDGSQFVVLATDSANAVQLYTAEGKAIATTNFHNNLIDVVTFSPDSAVLAFNDGDEYLYLWDTLTVQEITFATKIADSTSFSVENKTNVTYSSDGRYLATMRSFSVDLRDPVNGSLIREFTDVNGIAEDIEFSPDNTMLAVITSQGLYVFDVETGTRLAYFNHAYDWMNDVTWSPDQTMIATASSDHAVRIYTIQ